MERTTSAEGPAAGGLQFELGRQRAESEMRAQRFFRFGIISVTMIISLFAAGFTYFLQQEREPNIDSLLQHEIEIMSKDLRMRAEETRLISEQVIMELERQRERLASLPVTSEGNISKSVEVRLAALDSQITSVETELEKIHSANVVEKLFEIEKTMEGDLMKLLSVPLLTHKFDSFRDVTEKEILSLEKNVEKLESRIDFFVTTTLTLILGTLTAVLAPLFISFLRRRAANRSAAGSMPDEQLPSSP